MFLSWASPAWHRFEGGPCFPAVPPSYPHYGPPCVPPSPSPKADRAAWWALRWHHIPWQTWRGGKPKSETKIGNVYLKQPLLDENDESLLLGWGEMSLCKRKSCSQFPASGTGTAGRVPNSEQLRCISCAKMAAATHWPMEIWFPRMYAIPDPFCDPKIKGSSCYWEMGFGSVSTRCTQSCPRKTHGGIRGENE